VPLELPIVYFYTALGLRVVGSALNNRNRGEAVLHEVVKIALELRPVVTIDGRWRTIKTEPSGHTTSNLSRRFLLNSIKPDHTREVVFDLKDILMSLFRLGNKVH
jgi:hypothetical protein